MLEQKRPAIKVLKKKLFSNCMVQLPDSVVKIIGKTVSKLFYNPSSIVKKDLLHLKDIELIFPPKQIQPVSCTAVSSQCMGQEKEIKQECELTAQNMLSSEYVEVDSDIKEELEASELECKSSIVPFFN